MSSPAAPLRPAAGKSKRKITPAKKPSNAYIASLRAARISENVKASLPLELIAHILDYCAVPDLIRCARASTRLKEMVYDDTRWTQKLKIMGLWNEADARQRFEEVMKRKLEAQKINGDESNRRTGIGLPGQLNGDATGGRLKPQETLFDAYEDVKEDTSPSRVINGILKGVDGATNRTLLRPHVKAGSVTSLRVDTLESLDVLSNVKSVRGRARQEFGKVYAACAPFYFDLVRSESHNDAKVFKALQDPELQAMTLDNVRTFARCDMAPGWSARDEALESMIAVFENAALREFEHGYVDRDYDGRVKKYAHVLIRLNGGSAAIDYFLHNNPVMRQKNRYGHPLACLEGSSGRSVNLAPARSFFHALSTALDEQISVIDRVFPPSVDVLVPLLNRVGEDIIPEYINSLFDESHATNIESYVQIVPGVLEQALAFVSGLYPANGSGHDFVPRATMIITRCFEPHVDLYLQEEVETLKAKTNSEVETWERQLTAQEQSAESFFMSNVNRQAAKRDFLASFKKVVMMPVNVLPGMSASKPSVVDSSNASGRSTPSLVPDPVTGSVNPRAEAPTTELAAKAALMNSRLEGIGSLFSIEIALNLVHAAKSSIERASLFVQIGGRYGEEAKEQCQAIFIHLLRVLGHRHMKAGFDKAVSHLSTYKPGDLTTSGSEDPSESGVKPLVTFLELVNVGDLIQQMVDVFFVQQLVAHGLTDRDDFLDLAVKEKKKFEQLLDERVAAGLNRGIDVLMDEVDAICRTTQAPSDFRPGTWSDTAQKAVPPPAVADIGPTRTARQVVRLVSSHTGMLAGSTDKNMLDVFNQEVGVRLFALLCKHVKRQRISTDGAIILISDTNHYFSYVQSLRNKELLVYFKALRELSTIFLIDGRHAKELAAVIADKERYSGIFRVEEVLEFAERRADWYSIRGGVEKALYGMGCAVM